MMYAPASLPPLHAACDLGVYDNAPHAAPPAPPSLSLTPVGTSDALFARFPSITLDELVRNAALLRRVDRKYMVTAQRAAELLTSLSALGARILDINGTRTFHYISDYFDTTTFDLYHDAATKRRRRYKVRERFYCESGAHFVEVKIRDGRGRNVKKRLECAPVSQACVSALQQSICEPYTLSFNDTDEGRWIARTLTAHSVVSADDADGAVAALEPRVRTSYTRATILLPDGSRLTCDLSVQAHALAGRAGSSDSHARSAQIPFVIIETKSANKACVADRLLWERGVRPLKISKYAFGVASLYHQKANKWTRALRLIDQAQQTSRRR